MKNNHRISILILMMFCLGVIPGVYSALQFTSSGISTIENYQIIPKSVDMDTIGIDCDAVQFSVFKVYERIQDFYFTFDSSTLHYGIYFGAMFTGADLTHVTLQIYIFVVTLDDTYVSSLGMTFSFNLTGSFQGMNFDLNGSKSDTSSFWTTDPCLYQFALYSVEVNKNLLPETLSISLQYSLSCSEFSDKTGNYIKTASLSAFLTLDFVLLMVIIIGGAIGVLITILLIRRHRRNKFYQEAYDHWV